MANLKSREYPIDKILVDYYVNGLTNIEIFDKYQLERTSKIPANERLLTRLPLYQHPTIECEHCRRPLNSKYASKTKSGLPCDDFPKMAEAVVEQANQKPKIYEDLAEINSNVFTTKEGFKIRFPFCAICGHKPHNQCRCSQCKQLKNENFRTAVSQQRSFNRFTRHPNIESLSCVQIMGILETLGLWKGKCHGNEDQTENALTKLDKKGKAILAANGFISISDESIIASIQMISTVQYIVNEDRLLYTSNLLLPLGETIGNIQKKLCYRTVDPQFSWELIDAWENLALGESLAVLEYYCSKHEIISLDHEKMRVSILNSLSRYGLAQTCRYVCNAVRRTSALKKEHEWNDEKTLIELHKNLDFWINDHRARTYQAPPFVRMAGTLSEPQAVSLFSETFLNPWGIDYFTQPIRVASLSQAPRI